MCTSGDHGDIPAVGEAMVEDDTRWYPYCAECLLRCDPPRRWYPGYLENPATIEAEQDSLQATLRALAEKCDRLDERRHELHDLLTATTAERDHFRDAAAVANAAAASAAEAVGAMATKLSAVMEERYRLQTYVRHLDGCGGTYTGLHGCSCGLDQPLEKNAEASDG
jgi:hypothetical protein